MYLYAKVMYDAWCNGQDHQDIKFRYTKFISLAAKQLSMSEAEMEAYLKKTSWFVYPS